MAWTAEHDKFDVYYLPDNVSYLAVLTGHLVVLTHYFMFSLIVDY
jgi:hypothetical protein